MSSLSYLITFLSIVLLLQPILSLDLFTPITDTFKETVCKSVVCGKGTCTPSSNHTYGFFCDCKPGWKRTFSGDLDHYGFLPCVIPNCTLLDSTCSKDEIPPPEDKEPETNDTSVFNPCHWAYCGEGTCVRQGIFGHTCSCNKPGSVNLFNDTDYPCFNKCSLGTDCFGLGLTPAPQDNANTTNHASSVLPGKMLWMVILTVIMSMNPWK